MGGNDEKTHTNAETAMLVSIGKMETRLTMQQEIIDSHKTENDARFGKLFDAAEYIAAEVAKMPEQLTTCGTEFKREILEESKDKFASKTELKVLKTWIIAGVTIGSSAGAIVGAIFNYIVVMKGLISG